MNITRRSLIKALGAGAGVALFAPFLTQLHAEMSGQHTPRVVLFVEGNGIWPWLMMDPMTRAQLGGEQVFSYKQYTHNTPIELDGVPLEQATSLAALGVDPGQGLRDLVKHSAVVLGLSSKIAGGSHSSMTHALSLTRALEGPSIDAYISTQLDLGLPFAAMRVGVCSTPSKKLNYSLCTQSKKSIAPVILDPSEAFNIYFGSVAQGAGQAAFTKRKELLDFSVEQARKARDQFSGSSTERLKLERYFESLETMVNRHEELVELAKPGSALFEASQMYLSGEPGELTDDLYTSPFLFDRLQAQADMVTAALIGGLTNCAVVSCAAGEDWNAAYPEIQVLHGMQRNASAHDDLRHGAGTGTRPELAESKVLAEATSRQIGVMANIARKLADVPEAGGTMLDHTIFVYMSDNGEMHHSTASEWPMLLVGGQRLGFKTTGRSVVYPKQGSDNNRQVSNLFNTLGHACGLDLDEFGGEPPTQRIARGPLSELWSPV